MKENPVDRQMVYKPAQVSFPNHKPSPSNHHRSSPILKDKDKDKDKDKNLQSGLHSPLPNQIQSNRHSITLASRSIYLHSKCLSPPPTSARSSSPSSSHLSVSSLREVVSLTSGSTSSSQFSDTFLVSSTPCTSF